MAIHVKKSTHFSVFFEVKNYLLLSGRESSDKRPPNNNLKKNKK